MLTPGDRLGDWVVDGPLGSGAMGSVYRCHHVVTHRLRAAVKVLDVAAVGEGSPWFIREVEALARLSHPGIVGIRNPGVDEKRGVFYLAMELVEGETLRVLLSDGALPVYRACQLFGGIADALAFAHANRIYHRDIKPSNIMVRPDGSPVLVDFGIATDLDASQEAPEQEMGTPTYMPPEAFSYSDIDPAKADLYAVGVLMYEALTGSRAFPIVRGGDQTVYRQVRTQKVRANALDPGSGFPANLRQLVRTATAPDPEHRRLTMAQFADALRDPAITLATPSAPSTANRREWVLWVGGAVAFTVLASGVLGWLAYRWAASG